MPQALTILFVDDEPDLVPLIRQTFRQQVRDGSLTLAFAADGVEALEYLAAHPDVEVVVTDINMPRMDGLTLLGRLGDLGRLMKAVVVTAYGDMENIRTAMNRGAFDFLTKPINMEDLRITLGQAREAVERDREADRVRATITRYLSDKIAGAVLSDPEAFSGGQKREVSVLMSDISGFSQLAERLDAQRVVELLNVYLTVMTDVIDAHDGAIDEFIGDAILVIFGAPIRDEDHATKAVACAVDMQQQMAEVNRRLAERDLPPLEMTVAVNTGEVIVGTIGSEKRAKYGVVGSPVNLTSRIQTLAAPGEALVSEPTYAATGGDAGPVRIGETRHAQLKGFTEPVAIHSVSGIGDQSVPDDAGALAELAAEAPFTFAVLDGKRLVDTGATGAVVRASPSGALVRIDAPVQTRTDVRLTLRDAPGEAVYAKVVEVGEDEAGPWARLRFAALPPLAAAALGTAASPALT
ncbi:MAG TPA: adenylate/guanylate cyclase domain-containing protein [Rubricoccaceae bacterium]|jgi:adenylate cyclase